MVTERECVVISDDDGEATETENTGKVSNIIKLQLFKARGGGKWHFSSFCIFDNSYWRRTKRKKPDQNLTLRF